MSLRLRRAAAGSSPETAQAPRASDRFAVRLGGRLFALLPGTETTAGRSPECELVLSDRLCSRRHAQLLQADDGAVTVRDLCSTNGTYVNGIRLSAPRRLALGDWITIGNETFELCIAADEKRPETPTIPVGPSRALGARDAATSGAKTKTDPGSPLLSLASFTAMASSRAATPILPRRVRRPLDVLLRQAEAGQALDAAAPAMAVSVALHLAQVTRSAHWVSYCFRLYTALRRPLSPELIERLRATLSLVPHPEVAPFEAYLEVLVQSATLEGDEARARLGELRSFFE